MFTVRGLELLAELSAAAGEAADAHRCAAAAGALKTALLAKMWNPKTSRFCDGICADPKVDGHSGIYSDMYPLYLGLVPEGSVGNVWKKLAAWGLEQIGDYGAFVYFHALAAHPAGDTGQAALKALTKCDEYSWCHMMEAYDATMTREAFSSGTMSHAWGTAPITGTVNGIMGLAQTAPAYKAFDVKPRLGGVARASVRVPSPHGFIEINATALSTAVAVPCNTRASLCAVVPPLVAGQAQLRLALDGELLLADAIRRDGNHACVDQLGCGAAGAPRTVAWV